ncbi:MAG: cell filamentation protein Fic [Bacteroidetes bacterium]|nr:MAG: cell filamentation protein Fic [Bacteroidota bacterium]
MDIQLSNNQSDFLFYTSSEGKTKIQVILNDETVWLTQKSIAELFGVQRPAITKHLKNIFESEELNENSVSSILEHTADDNKTYKTKFYNLDAIISIGYRVNSKQATRFRQWATNILQEYMIKGFTLDDERLKQGKQLFGKDYFDELLERIREIRASERRFYQKITDIYAQCSIDYDAKSELTRTFYKTVQNKLHWAITGQTAAEIIQARVNADKPHLGLTSWKNSPKGKILKSDTSIAKNYLNQIEIDALNEIVTMYLDYAGNQAKRQILMKMKDWIERLDAFLQFNQYDILKNAGKVSAKVAKKLAENEYKKFRIKQDDNFLSDFDNQMKRIEK